MCLLFDVLVLYFQSSFWSLVVHRVATYVTCSPWGRCSFKHHWFTFDWADSLFQVGYEALEKLFVMGASFLECLRDLLASLIKWILIAQIYALPNFSLKCLLAGSTERKFLIWGSDDLGYVNLLHTTMRLCSSWRAFIIIDFSRRITAESGLERFWRLNIWESNLFDFIIAFFRRWLT